MKTLTKQVVINQYGTPEVMHLLDAEIPHPKQGELIIKTEAIGVNYSDTLRRRDLYFQPTPLPYILGAEAVGEIVEVGEGVDAPYTKGTRVLAILPFGGGYAEHVSAIAQYCVPLPPHVDSKTATAIFVQGSTAQLMISELAQDLRGKTVFISAAAGGVGSLLVQLAALNGARVIAGASSDSKLQEARNNGAAAVVNYSRADWQKELKKADGEKGIDVAFETVGGDVYNHAVRSVAEGGKVIVYGCASGVQGSVHPEYFVDANISLLGFNLAHYITQKTPVWQEALGAVIGMVAEGKLKISTAKTFALKDAAEAHRQIEARQTTGKVVLIPA